jgi:hypothetical protein
MTDPRLADPTHTVPLVVPPTTETGPAAPTTRFADLPEAPPAYHAEPEPPKARTARKRRPLHPQEATVLAVAMTVLVLVVAKALVDANDVRTNVVDVLLYAVLAALVGIAVVGVGGGLIRPMQARWERLLDGPEDTGRQPDHTAVYPSEPTLAPRRY